MPVYHITLHAYRSWRADHKRGYTDRKKGVVKPDPKKAAQWDRNAKHPKVEFDQNFQAVLISGAHDICQRRGWRLHGVGTDPTHPHFLISWRGFVPWTEVRRVLKNILSLMLGRLTAQQGRRWFVTGDSDRQVTTKAHFDCLIETYFPNHPGLFWKEGEALPEIPANVLDDERASKNGYRKSVNIPKKRKQPKKK